MVKHILLNSLRQSIVLDLNQLWREKEIEEQLLCQPYPGMALGIMMYIKGMYYFTMEENENRI
jgi:hypothetical protein